VHCSRASTAADQRENDFKGFKDFLPKSVNKNLILTVLFVPNSPHGGLVIPRAQHGACRAFLPGEILKRTV
jgi:hypothetical protein